MVVLREICWILAAIFFACLVTGTYGSESTNSNAESSGAFDLGVVVGGVASLVMLVVVVAVCAERRVRVENLERGPPYWTRSLVHKPEYNGGLSGVSDGINNLSPFHVVRDRLGTAVTDGARWDVGFTVGKHVFEVIWPAKRNRGTNCSIGVVTKEVPLKKPGRVTLVGHHSQSWGFDLSRRRSINADKIVGNFVRQIPDRFFLYLDMDSGKIGFGDDVKAHGRQALFFGNLVNGIKTERDVPKHLMIGMCSPREEVQVYYIGTAIPQGGFDLVPPDPVPAYPAYPAQAMVYNGGNVVVMTGVQQQPMVPPLEELKVQPEPVPQTATY